MKAFACFIFWIKYNAKFNKSMRIVFGYFVFNGLNSQEI